MPDGPVILLLAGEVSGDLHGAEVARELRRAWPGARLVGLGGPLMEAEGVELLAGLDQLAVMGFAEVVSRLPYFLALERRVKGLLRSGQVDLVLPIDYPGFNLRIARAARRRSIPVLYYIAPQVWAWRQGRAAKLAHDADQIAVILPFEVEFLQRFGARVSFVGHPLLERGDEVPTRGEFAESYGLDAERPVLALFPGSRPQEIGRHLDVFAAAARLVTARRPDVQPAVARAASVSEERLRAAGFPLVADGRALLHHGAAAIVKSGTTTLEAALEGIPFVVAYRTHPLTFFLAKRLVSVDHVAMANLVAGERVVPEVLQDEATPARLAELVTPLLEVDSPERKRIIDGLSRVRGALGTPGASRRVVQLAAELLARTPRNGKPPA